MRGTHATLENLIGPYVCLKIKSLIVRYRITLDCEPSSDEARLHESCLELSLSTEGRFLQPGFSLFSHNFIDSFLDSCLNCFASFRRSSHRSSRNSYPPQKFMSTVCCASRSRSTSLDSAPGPGASAPKKRRFLPYSQSLNSTFSLYISITWPDILH